MRIQLSMISLVVVAATLASGCQGRLAYNLPPSSRLMHPGPGVGGPGPGVIPPGTGMGGAMSLGAGMPPAMGPGMGPGMGPYDSGVCQCSYECGPGGYGGPVDGGCYGAGGLGSGSGTSQVAFLGEDGIQVQWDVSGQGMFDSTPLVIPGRQNFMQGSIYRLRVSQIPGRPGVQLYPTLEVAPVTPRTDAYLAHAPIPVQFTEEDFDQVLSGNFVTKVMYLPDPEFQELALAGVETLVSARLDPGVDPISEADRRGSILAILRIGSKDLEMQYGEFNEGSVLPAQFEDGPQPVLERTPSGHAFSDDYPSDGGIVEGEVYEGEVYGGEVYDGNCYDGGCYDGGCYDGGGYAGGGYDAASANMPVGMPTAGLAPAIVPPHLVSAPGPQYGMPITGTPIGLPGPPHIPLGAPAGLQKHVMKNRTRMDIPHPVQKMRFSVKQRPGLNYPEPVRKAMVDETVRQPFNLRALLGH